MLVYRNDERVRETASAWAELTAEVEALSPRSLHDDIVAVAIDLGEIEAAVADRLFPDADGIELALLLSEYVNGSGDRDVAARLQWHRLAYLAFRTGYVTLAAESLGNSSDGRRFRVQQKRYTTMLREELALTWDCRGRSSQP